MPNITREQVEQTARNLSTKLITSNQAQSAEIEKLMTELQNANIDQEDLKEISAILALPEEQFTMIAPAFLAELEKGYSNINTQMLLVQAMNIAGKKYFF